MTTDEQIEKHLKQLKKGLWVNPLLLLIGGGGLSYWLVVQGKWLDFSNKFPMFETTILKESIENTAWVIFFVLLLSVLFNTLQMVNTFRLLLALIEKLKDKSSAEE